MKKKIISILLALPLALCLAPTAMAVESPTAAEAYAAARTMLSQRKEAYTWAGNGGADDWDVFALARDGVNIPRSYLSSVKVFIPAANTDVTDCARAILTLTACGETVSEVLLAGVTNRDNMTSTNAVIFSLLALDSKNYVVPTGCMSRNELVTLLLSLQQTDNAWGYSYFDGTDWITSYGTDVDTTAEAIAALAPYYSDANVKAAVDSGLEWLKTRQITDGSFGYMGSPSVESTAQVIVALTTLGLDPTTWNGKDAVAAMCTMAVPTGGFISTYTGEYDEMSTYQGYYALVAYERYKAHKNALYDMSDVQVILPVRPVPADPTTPAKLDKEVSAAKTADSGILFYGVLSVSALLGMGYVGKKKF